MKRPAWWYDRPTDADCRCDESPCRCDEIREATEQGEADLQLLNRELSERDA